MAVQPTPTNYVTLDLLAWQEQGTLVLSPKFQRRAVWKRVAKSYFIDTMLRGYPVPPIHIRLTAAPKESAAREVVDGQQRLRALFDFIADKYRLSGQLEGSWAGKTYSELAAPEQERLRLYSFHVFQYQNVDDRTILEVFARINTYSVALNRQELRNGKYFGLFKQAVYALAFAHLQFWRTHGIFTEGAIARMQEAELVGELLVMQLDGLQDKKTSLDDFYLHLDNDWRPEAHPWTARGVEKPLAWLSRKESQERFEQTITSMELAIGDLLGSTAFYRVPLFYTTYAAIYHRVFGLPGFDRLSPHRELDKDAVLRLRTSVEGLSELLAEDSGAEDLRDLDRDFVVASARQTDNIAPRRRRLEVLWDRAELGRSMPRQMPPLSSEYSRQVGATLSIVASTEALWLMAPPASQIKRQLKVDRLEALYEAAFLRLFAAWENYLEEILVRLMAGYRTPGYIPSPAAGKKILGTISSARAELYGGRDYLVWHRPQTVVDMARTHLISSPVEAQVTSGSSRLADIARVRHRIAHSSTDAEDKFRQASLAITGTAHRTPGRLLRAQDISDPLNQPKWIRVLSDELKVVADAISM